MNTVVFISCCLLVINISCDNKQARSELLTDKERIEELKVGNSFDVDAFGEVTGGYCDDISEVIIINKDNYTIYIFNFYCTSFTYTITVNNTTEKIIKIISNR